MSAHSLWIAAIIVRAIAIGCGGLNRVPVAWLTWAAFCEVTDLVAFYLAEKHMGGAHGPYVAMWAVQQVIGIVLLAALVRQRVQPPPRLVAAASTAAVFLSAALLLVFRYPSSHIEPVLLFCGTAALAMGLMTFIVWIAMPGADRGVLCGYLLAYAMLSLAAPEYLKSSGLGKAWEMVDVLAFGAWGIVYVRFYNTRR